MTTTTTPAALVGLAASIAAAALALAGTATAAPPDVALIGDSVTHITTTYGALLTPQVDAANGRATVVNALSDNGLDAIKALRAQGAVPRRWIIELGLNDLAYQTHDVTVLRARIRELVVATGGRTYGSVYWVVPYVNPVPRPLLASYAPALVSALHLVGFGPTTLVRWDHVAVPADTYDGVHPTAAGAAKYASLINRAAAQP